MITLDRLEKKIDALTAGVNSALLGQQDLRNGILSAKAQREQMYAALSTKPDGACDGLADEIRETRQQILLLIGILHDAKQRRGGLLALAEKPRKRRKK